MRKFDKLITKRKIIIVILVLVCFFMVGVADNYQQYSFMNLRNGYIAMDEGNYKKASEKFSKYLSVNNSVLYWKMMALFNGEESEYAYSVVKEKLEICRMKLPE